MSISKVSFDGSPLIDLTNDTITSTDFLPGKYAHISTGERIEGTMPTLAETTYTPGTTDQIITLGKYLSGNQTISGDANLLAENIKTGVSIFGINGTCGGNVVTGTINGTGTKYLTVQTGISGTVKWFYISTPVSDIYTDNIQSATKVYNSTTGLWTLKADTSGNITAISMSLIQSSSTGLVSLSYMGTGSHVFAQNKTYTWFASL